MTFASRESIFIEAISKHNAVKNHWQPLMIDDISKGRRNWVRITGWGSNLRQWKERLNDFRRRW